MSCRRSAMRLMLTIVPSGVRSAVPPNPARFTASGGMPKNPSTLGRKGPHWRTSSANKVLEHFPIHVDSLIVGGGLAGTTVAAYLLERRKEFTLIESSSRLGGKVEPLLTDQACFEFGPNSFTNQSDEILVLLDKLGLKEEILSAAPCAKNRYILKEGRLARLPGKPQEMLTTQALSLGGRLRFFLEPFYVPKRKKEEESIQDFFVRHFGREVADCFADPFVSGIYAGDASQLSLAEAMPTMAAAEAQCNSLIRYLISQRKTAKASPESYELKRGLESLFHRAAERIGKERLHLSEETMEIVADGGKIM